MTVTEKFLNALKEDEKLREYAKKNIPAEGTDKENVLVSVANAFGYKITKEELIEALNARKAQIENPGQTQLRLLTNCRKLHLWQSMAASVTATTM